jgi:hypothetical protein
MEHTNMEHSTHVIFTEYDWNTFMKGTEYSLCTESYSQKYPTLGNYENMYGFTKELLMKFIEIAHEKEGISYQTCLNDIITTLLNGNRYASDIIYKMTDVIRSLVEKGATFPESILFENRYSEIISIEDETVDYKIRGELIDTFHDLIDVSKYADWKNIKAHYYCEDYSIKNDGIERFCCLKYYSEQLRTTYPNDEDDKSF